MWSQSVTKDGASRAWDNTLKRTEKQFVSWSQEKDLSHYQHSYESSIVVLILNNPDKLCWMWNLCLN